MKPQSSPIFIFQEKICNFKLYFIPRKEALEKNKILNQSRYFQILLYQTVMESCKRWSDHIERGNWKLSNISIKKDWSTPFQNVLCSFSISFCINACCTHCFSRKKCLFFSKLVWARGKTFHWKNSIYFWSPSHLTGTIPKAPTK